MALTLTDINIGAAEDDGNGDKPRVAGAAINANNALIETAVDLNTAKGAGDALVANPLSQFAATTSLQLLGVMSNETGTGSLCFATSPTLVTPALGTPASGVLSNCSGFPVTLSAAQEYTKTQNFNATTLTDAANISWDLESNQVAKVTLAGNRTLDNPTNMVDGATYILRVIQDAGGTNTLAYGTAYLWPSGVAPTVTATGDAIDIITFVSDGTNMYGVISQDFS